MMLAVLDHLWQSTLCFGAAALLALILRRNSARSRYWVWFAASMKFLVPLAPLMTLGQQLAARATIPTLFASMKLLAPLASVMSLGQHLGTQLLTPALMPTAAVDVGLFSQGLVPVDSASTAPTALTAPLLTWQQPVIGVWVLGVLVSAACWAMHWWRVRQLVREGRPLAISAPIPSRMTRASFEPGLIGIVRPVLLLPEGLMERLSAQEMQAILAHEFCHLRRRDNLTFALHMITQTLFWFYPLTWWLGRRLVNEREHACDEMVLAAGHDAGAYSASILKVCRFAIPGPLGLTAGVLGLDLKSRVESILDGCTTIPMSGARKLLLAATAAAPFIVPIGLGLLSSPSEALSSAVPTPAERAQLLAEQEQPQKEVPFDPRDFDRFVGYYQLARSVGYFVHVWRSGDHFYSQLTGQRPVEEFPAGPTEFFDTVFAAQWSYVFGPHGEVTEALLHQDGFLYFWLRVSKSTYEADAAALQQRIAQNRPSPGTEDALRRQIEEVEETGHPLYAAMDPQLAAMAYEQQAQLRAEFKKWGAFQSLRFYKVMPAGRDDYLATFTHARVEVTIAPLSPDGKTGGLLFNDIP
jgi:beta-lactamase regulating signal transducer with metallopeptidase domain